MGPEALAQVLRPLTGHIHPNLIVGLQTSDDAAVYRLSDDQAIIQTVDFFPPVVDDAFAYGAISAANSMSDVYAMGGDVLFALNIAAFPDDLPRDILSRIFEGGASKVVEAGGVIAGGHTITDDEPKYGLSVTGTVHPDRILTKAGAKPGDLLFLTKPIGTGLITTAHRNGIVAEEHLQPALDSMLKLNRAASLAAREIGPNACTDVTGFGLLGHGFEIAVKSGVGLRIQASRVPLLPGALEYAARGQQPGGLGRNRDYYSSQGVAVASDIPLDLAALLYDPQTSGGLLLSVAMDRHEALLDAFAAAGETIWVIGDVVAGRGVSVTRS
jgi:selenide,water dikinase